MATTLQHMKVTPLSPAMGAAVTGINAADLDNAGFNALRDALHEHLMLAVRDQALDPAAQTAFTQRFGEIQYHINSEYKLMDQPEVLVLSTKLVNGKNIGIPDAGSDWHSDHAYVDRPTAYTILQSITVPKQGGDTEWTSMAAAYDGLDAPMKQKLEGLIGIHSFNRFRNPRMTRPTRHPNPAQYFAERSPPDAFHPIVRTNPFTGRKALYISPRFTLGIKDMDDSQAQSLLDALFAHIANRDFVYHHKWRPGDLVMWDNRATLHLACGGVKLPEIRHMHRTTVLGEVPF